MRYVVCAALAAVFGAGCGNPRLAEMAGKPAEVVQWAPLDQVRQDVLMGTGYPLGRNDWNGARNNLKSKAAKAAVDQFVAAPLPSELSGRDAAKTEADGKLKALLEAAAKSAPNDQLKAAYDEAVASVGKFQTGGTAE